MRLRMYALFALPACYAPSIFGGVPCEPQTASCPSGQTCQAAGEGFICSTRDAGGKIDGGDDATPPDGAMCLGEHLIGSLCLTRAPSGPVTLSSTTPINSANVAPGGCTEVRQLATGPLCIIAGTTITVPASASYRVFAVNPAGTAAPATTPVVLFATESIAIEGTLDVASHVGDQIAGMPVLGAGARSAIGCAAINLDGVQGRAAGGGDSFGGGGAAGGSLGTLGGAGGNGGNGGQVGHGNPVLGSAPTMLAGGCPGGNGGNGDGGDGGGLGGGGGGSVYLLAGDSITVSGKINASGGGGERGGAGMFSSGGGGGGGSGGMIGIEAPHIAISGALIANGGGGASGSGGQEQDMGAPGSDPAAPTTAAPGGPGSDGGGAGGAGSVGTGTGAAGRNGGGQTPQAAGGGGGGGAGIIQVFGTSPVSLTGPISPPVKM